MWSKVNTAGNSEFVIITFPDGDQVSIAGVIAKVKTKKGKTSLKDPPRMGVTITLKYEPGLFGACGNFDGNGGNDNAVANNLNSLMVNPGQIPAGVLEEDQHSSLVRSLLDSDFDVASASKSETYPGEAQLLEECDTKCGKTFLATAEAQCAGLPEADKDEACVYDICKTCDESFATDAFLIELLTVVQGDGVVTAMAEPGKCVDVSGHTYRSLKHHSIDTEAECVELLELVAKSGDGIEGAQLGDGDKCEILFNLAEGMSLKHLVADLGVNEESEAPGTGGHELIYKTDGVPGYKCWKVE